MGTIYVDDVLPSSRQYLRVGQGSRTLPLYAKEVGELAQFRVKRSTSVDFPYYLLSNPDGTVLESQYPDYVSYLRSVAVEVPSFTSSGAVTCTASNSTTLSLSSAFTLSVGDILYVQVNNTAVGSQQYREVVAVASSTSVTLDEPFTVSARPFSVVSTVNSTTDVSGTWLAGNVEFTFSDNVANRLLFDALVEDSLYSGAVVTGPTSNVVTYTPLNNAFNNTNGFLVLRCSNVDVPVTSLKFNNSTGARSVTVSTAVTPSSVVTLYPYRLASVSNARHRQVLQSTLMNEGYGLVSGLRVRDRFQGHWHDPWADNGASGANAFSVSYSTRNFSWSNAHGQGLVQVRNPITDGTNGTPRTGQFTRPRALGVYLYEYVGTVVS